MKIWQMPIAACFPTQGIISTQVRDAAIDAPLDFQKKTPLVYPADVSKQKTAGLIRSNLMTMLGLGGFYDLDRLDLDARSSMDTDLQRYITKELYSLKDPVKVQKTGLIGPHLLDKGDPSKVIYSFTLYERSPLGNILRVQTNNFDGSFNIDEQMKLDMGSSAKLRVLVLYLDILAKLHNRYLNLTTKELWQFSINPSIDPLTRWTATYLATSRTNLFQPFWMRP